MAAKEVIIRPRCRVNSSYALLYQKEMAMLVSCPQPSQRPLEIAFIDNKRVEVDKSGGADYNFATTIPEPSSEAPPDNVKANYTTDLQILKIHEAIVARFASLRGQIPQMRTQIIGLRAKMESKFLSIVEKKSCDDRVVELERDIYKYDSGTSWNTYISAALPVLKKYIPLMSDEIKGIVTISGKKDIVKKEDTAIINSRLEIIREYLHIARNYITLDISWQGKNVAQCPNCGVNFSDMFVDEEIGVHSCPCGYEREVLSKDSSFKDSLRVNIGGRNSYEDRETFEKVVDRFSGNHDDKIPEKLYEQLDEYYTSKGFPTGAQIKVLPTLPNGRKPHTSINLLIEGLGKTSNAAFYSSGYLIAHNYWEWKLADLTELKPKIMDDYDKTQAVYNVIKTRDSSLNAHIRLYLHLKALDYPCDRSDFKDLSSRESLEYHHSMWMQMCAATGVKFTPLI